MPERPAFLEGALEKPTSPLMTPQRFAGRGWRPHPPTHPPREQPSGRGWL